MKVYMVVVVLAVASVQGQNFEPADCDWEKEFMCPGKWNTDWTEQVTADECIPNRKVCTNMCSVDCGESRNCPGGVDDKGCPMPDLCHPGSKYLLSLNVQMI